MHARFPPLLVFVAGVLVGTGLTLVRDVLAVRERHEPPGLASPAAVPAGLLDEVRARIRQEYVEDVDDALLEQGAARGMLASLDPHSAFLDAAEYDEMRLSTSGVYTGVGIEVAVDDGLVTVVSPIEGSPAAAAGVRSGDVILEVDGTEIPEGALDAAIEQMRGLPGTRVQVAVARDGVPGPLRFELERSEIHVSSVRSEPLGRGLGYLRISHFSESTPSELGTALAALSAAGLAPMRGLVLDLRGNPGGVLEAAVAVADAFLERGLVVRADGRTPDARFAMSATPGDALDGAPLAVLLDSGSASAAEIVAGALRDHGRAALLGRRSFGKGSVQTVMPLAGGQAIKLTTSRYYTPSGESIQERGLEPDVVLEAAVEARDGDVPPSADPEVLAAAQYLEDRALQPGPPLRSAAR